jgi:foldase protein PrsA
MKKQVRILILSILLSTTFLSGCTIADKEYVLDLNYVGRNDVLSINGEECSIKEAKLYLCNYQNLYGTEYGVDLWNYEFNQKDVPSTLEEYVKDITLLQLSNITCMNQLAKQMKISLTEEEESLVEKAAEDYYASLNSEELTYIGLDLKDLKKFYKKYAIAEKLYSQLTQGVNEEVSIDEARAIRIQQIFVTSKEDAQAVQKKLDKGDDFSITAGAYNEAKNIELTIVRGTLPKIVEDAAYILDNEQHTNMIETEDGYYFIKCLSKNVEEMTEKNKENIIAKRKKEQFDDVFHFFVDESEFEIKQKLWDEVRVDTSGKIVTKSFFEVYDKYFT